ncbi:MAG: phosphoglucosamine mutase [Clostridia bacterium]|nr:phosphoglucosamine mutase [Clostridia bacterium]
MKYFGTDGIRGVYGEKMTEALAYNAGLGFALAFGGDVIVGTDTRTSGEALSGAVISGLLRGGCRVKRVGIVPSPCVSFLAAKHRCGGIMVSASHNPPCYNGLKFFGGNGCKLTAEDEAQVEYFMDHPIMARGYGSQFEFGEGRQEYVDFLVSQGGNLCGREVVLDCAFGAGSTVAAEAFLRCGAKVRAVNETPEGDKINCGVGALYPSFVASMTDGLGFAFDGDADRLAVTCGGEVDGDSVLYNLALLTKPRGVVGTIMNNGALECALGSLGIKFVRTAVGDKHISEEMARQGFTLGGEQSGHYIISPAVSGDGVLTALRLSAIEKFERLSLIPQRLESVSASAAVLFDHRFLRAKAECEATIGGGRLIVRASGTEAKIRVMAEGEDGNLLDRIVDLLTTTIKLCEKGEL